MLPRMSGFEVCRRLRAERFTMPIIMLTARNAEIDRVAGLEIGADDYLGKPFGVRELVARVRVQLRRAHQPDRRPTRSASATSSSTCDCDAPTRGRRPLDLSSREFELLEYLIDHADKVVTREELLSAVWGYGEAPLTRTVDNFVAKLRKKVERDPARSAPHPHGARLGISVHSVANRQPPARADCDLELRFETIRDAL